MSAYVRSNVRAALYAGMTMTTLGSSIGGQNTVAAPTLAPMRSDRRPELSTLLVAGAFILAALAGLWIVRPIAVAPIGPDAAAPVIAWERLVAGHRLEGYLSQTSKPLLTAVYGVAYAIAGDFRAVSIVAILSFAALAAAATRLALRLSGLAAA